MAYTVHYGTIATTGSSSFRILLYVEDPIYNTSNYTLKYYWAIQVTEGDFHGSILNSSYSGEYSITLNGTGVTATSSVITENISYGTIKNFSGWASYTGGSGTTYKSTISFTASPTAVKIYNGSTWQTAIPWVYDGSTWKQATPWIYNGTKWCSGSLME